MQIFRVLENPEAVAAEAARFIALEARSAVAARGRFNAAFSGGRTPWQMLWALSREDLPWERVHVLQVDERFAPEGDPDRNFTHLQEALKHAPVSKGQVYPMPVDASDPETGAREYARTLEQLAGSPPILDLVHLGLGPDGHTASLVPNDPVLEVKDREVAVTGPYQNRRRMTLTFPVLNRARRILWVVTGAEKLDMLRRLRQGDTSIPAGRIRREQTSIVADRAAAGGCESFES